MNLKDQIIALRNQNYTYDQIKKALNCSKSIISYYCGENQSEKRRNRQKTLRSKQHPFIMKINRFLFQKRGKPWGPNKDKLQKVIYNKIYDFTRGKNVKITLQDILDKVGTNPVCYLTGESIDINKPKTYEFDHIIPASRGGQSTLDNLGICTKQANRCKQDLTPDELINLCKVILQNQGYKISK